MIKIVDTKTKNTFEINPTKSGENSIACPACGDLHPKNRNRKCFSWNDQKKAGFCHRCESHFVEFSERKTKEEFTLPTLDNTTEVSEDHLKWFQNLRTATLNASSHR